jgi:spore cortex formation protein SpoVR/YcgB (stage V sporulation)
MRLIDKLKDSWLTHQEIEELEHYVNQLEIDANRYRWLNKYTSQLLMVTEKQMNEQIDKTMGKKT